MSDYLSAFRHEFMSPLAEGRELDLLVHDIVYQNIGYSDDGKYVYAWDEKRENASLVAMRFSNGLDPSTKNPSWTRGAGDRWFTKNLPEYHKDLVSAIQLLKDFVGDKGSWVLRGEVNSVAVSVAFLSKEGYLEKSHEGSAPKDQEALAICRAIISEGREA